MSTRLGPPPPSYRASRAVLLGLLLLAIGWLVTSASSSGLTATVIHAMVDLISWSRTLGPW